MGVLARPGLRLRLRLPGLSRRAVATTRVEQERDLQRRAVRWLGTTVITWPVWAMTGAPTGLPRVVADHHHVVATLGIWPAYLMIGGLADVARRARRTYVEPLLDETDDD